MEKEDIVDSLASVPGSLPLSRTVTSDMQFSKSLLQVHPVSLRRIEISSVSELRTHPIETRPITDIDIRISPPFPLLPNLIV